MKNRRGLRLGSMLLAVCFLANLFLVPSILLSLLDRESDISTASFRDKEEGPEVLELKMAMALPYASEWDSPKKGKGLLERNGEFYTLVERNFANDTLYFKYVKNNNAREIFSMLSDNVGTSDESPQSNSSDSSSLLSNWMFLKFKTNSEDSFKYLNLYFSENPKVAFCHSDTFSSFIQLIDTPPPRFI